MFPLRLLASEF